MKNTPTIFMIFGATGDLAEKKLFPALFDLFVKKLLPSRFRIVAVGRKDFNNESFRMLIHRDSLRHAASRGVETEFISLIEYFRGAFDHAETYASLAKRLSVIDRDFGVCSNKLFYFSTPPSLYELLITELSRSGLTIPCGGDKGWTRVLVEKPFGRDSETAEKLDMLLGRHFREEQIFRIDHYLAKETLQNITTFRFSNTIFEPLWNKDHIDSVEINLFETSTMGKRGPFYDGIGALRDVGQNHLLNMLALIAMERPVSLAPSDLRYARAQVLRKLKPISAKNVSQNVFRAQYEAYRSEPGVRQDSSTETFFSIRTFVNNRRWRGVPFILSSGKALSNAKAEIKVHFKDPDPSFFLPEQLPGQEHNTLTFLVQPEEGIAINFWIKMPGFDKKIERKDLKFKYSDSSSVNNLPNAYQRVIYDCVAGDQTLFASTDEVRFSWEFITSVLNSWKRLPLHQYRAGSAGPEVEFS